MAGKVRAIAMPAQRAADRRYEIAIAVAAARPGAAQAFVDALLGPDGRQRASRAGFLAP